MQGPVVPAREKFFKSRWLRVKFDAFLGKIWPINRRIVGCRQYENRHILKLYAYLTMLNLRRRSDWWLLSKVMFVGLWLIFLNCSPQWCDKLFWHCCRKRYFASQCFVNNYQIRRRGCRKFLTFFYCKLNIFFIGQYKRCLICKGN